MDDNIDVLYPKIKFVESTNECCNKDSVHVSSDISNDENSEIVFCCSICEVNFTSKNEFDQHNREYHSVKQYMCTTCNSKFQRQDHLKRHILSVHSISKCCICPVCSKDCKRHDVLLNHIRNQHSDKPQIFHCRECDFECGSLSELEGHEVSHLSSERHSCPHCKLSFKRRDHMLRHIKSQHLNESISCPICKQKYKRRDHVVRHIREKHKMGFVKGKLFVLAEV